MNLYCEKCSRIVESDPCPVCGCGPVRAPEPRDLCFLTEQGYVQATILADILTQNGIPYMDDTEVWTPEEIDDLDVFVPEKMNLEELTRFKKKLEATLREVKLQERVCRERINLLRDMIDETDYLFEDLSE